jgi:hypothetical protein
MTTVSFADVAEQSINFSNNDPAEALVLKLIDCAWVQRLRDISQTANTRLVYMFSEHSRFGHSLGVAYLACQMIKHLAEVTREKKILQQINEWKSAVTATALLHDVGHLAPGSHIAFKTWFSDLEDSHEKIATCIITQDQEIRDILNSFSSELLTKITAILEGSKEAPPWTWQIIAGGGWNVDRGNWCIVDSIMAGVSYGRYNVPALTSAIKIREDGRLVLSENRIDAMMHFALSRHAMYRQVYQHRVILAADMLNQAVVKRARDLRDFRDFNDRAMRAVLTANSPEELLLDNIFLMREAWWRYHLLQWCQSQDKILADLSNRLINRRLFKTVRVTDDNKETLIQQSEKFAQELDFDARYYLHPISTVDTQASDQKHSLKVEMDDGRLIGFNQAEPLFDSLARESLAGLREWLAMPEELKIKLGRKR